MNQGALKNVLKARKGKGVDITIMLGLPKDQMNEKDDLAPDLEKDEQSMDGSEKDLAVGADVDSGEMLNANPVKDPMHEDEAQDMNLIKKMLMAGGIGKRGMMSSKMKK